MCFGSKSSPQPPPPQNPVVLYKPLGNAADADANSPAPAADKQQAAVKTSAAPRVTTGTGLNIPV
jgi:hypothetical protein